MSNVPSMQEPEPDNNQKSAPLGPAGLLAIVVLIGFLIWAVWYAVHAWRAMSGVDMGVSGWIAMVLGVVVTVALGAGLMALVFYSSRHHYDR